MQNLLDTFLLQLLQYPPCHATIAALVNHLRHEIEFHRSVVEELRGPLAIFALADERAQKQKPTVEEGKDGRDLTLKKRQQARAAKEAQITSYQIETVTF